MPHFLSEITADAPLQSPLIDACRDMTRSYNMPSPSSSISIAHISRDSQPPHAARAARHMCAPAGIASMREYAQAAMAVDVER